MFRAQDLSHKSVLDTSPRRWDLMVSWPHGAWGWGLLYLGDGLFAFFFLCLGSFCFW